MKCQIYDGYSEGWALYCESFDDIYTEDETYWRYMYDLHRSLRLIIDTGIHYYKWDYQRCFHLMKTHLCYDTKEIKDEIYRYICLPGQALTYKMGESILFELRSLFLQQNKSIKDFHQKILDVGPCPLIVLMDYGLK